jgi:hypothetical protein|tara:strand:+ start:348 stop:452 length:105 start_codon:yes stop_codon:yes gene_type:complete
MGTYEPGDFQNFCGDPKLMLKSENGIEDKLCLNS